MDKSIFCLFVVNLATHTDRGEDGTGEGSSDGEDVGLILTEGAPVGVIDGNAEVDGA